MVILDNKEIPESARALARVIVWAAKFYVRLIGELLRFPHLDISFRILTFF